jgi:hypothetical protein
MLNLEIKAAAYKDGPILTTVVPNFPSNLKEAVAKYGEDNVFADFVRNYVIKVQGKMRAEYNAKDQISKTKKGSALAQVTAARRRAAILAAESESSVTDNEETETTDNVEVNADLE